VKPFPRRVLGWALAVAVTLGVVGLSRAPYAVERGDHAEIRLAWRFKSERVRSCRALRPEELANVPEHMRQTEVCERGLRPYRLAVSLDGTALPDDTIRARGAEGDRPLFVFRRFAVAPGSHALRVAFTPVGGGRDTLALDTAVVLAARRVALLTLDEDSGRLVVRTALR
jgi:hypothetical protein